MSYQPRCDNMSHRGFRVIGRVKWHYTDTGCLHTGNSVGTFEEQRERGMPKAFRVCLFFNREKT